jgi:dCMP deaminase
MPNSSYDTGLNTCIAIHAEANALLRSGTRSQGAIMYITGEPCDGCVKLMKGAQIWKTVWPGGIMIISPGEEWIDG